MRAQPVPWPYKSSDQSAAAMAWRNLSSVSWALNWLDDSLHLRGEAQYTAYRHPQRQLLLHPAFDDAKVSVRDLALGFELALGPMNLRKLVDAGMGVPMHGVYTQQSVTDVATLHRLLWRAKPSLLVEVGTMCGGSAIFYARTMMGYDPRAEVWTFDTNKNEGDRLGRCRRFHTNPAEAELNDGVQQGLEHPSWKELQASGNLKVVRDSVLSERWLAALREKAASARGVFVIDDANHIMSDNLMMWEGLSSLVSPGSYYLVQDTRLDTDCAYAVLVGRGGWCGQTWRKGGPARAVAAIVTNETFARDWVQDRAVETWAITQHPGGYMRRRGGGEAEAAARGRGAPLGRGGRGVSGRGRGAVG